MSKAPEKTNVMRILDRCGVKYEAYRFESEGALSGLEVARLLGLDERAVYKTLVTVGKSKEHYVFVIPVACELDLKKAAAAAGEKSIEMIPQKELLPLTGYVHGGCSPVGMKKQFRTFLDRSAETIPAVIISAGKIGAHVGVAPEALRNAVPFSFAELTVSERKSEI